MRSIMILPFVVILLVAAPSRGKGENNSMREEASVREPRIQDLKHNQLSVDVGILSLSVGYARSVGRQTYLGIDGGFGVDFLNFSRVGGDNGGRMEFLHVDFFVRREHVRPIAIQYDVGLRANMHGHNYGGDTWAELFAGLYGDVLLGWSHFKVGPRVMAGLYSDGFGFTIVPITARVNYAW